jgi:hypothetical protein
MFTKTKIALSAAIVLSNALTASAATKHRVTQLRRSAVYNMVPNKRFSRPVDPIWRALTDSSGWLVTSVRRVAPCSPGNCDWQNSPNFNKH